LLWMGASASTSCDPSTLLAHDSFIQRIPPHDRHLTPADSARDEDPLVGKRYKADLERLLIFCSFIITTHHPPSPSWWRTLLLYNKMVV
jgi:hypothetical protein